MSTFVRAALTKLKNRAKAAAKQLPPLKHMLVLPPGHGLCWPRIQSPGLDLLGEGARPLPIVRRFGGTSIRCSIPSASHWPADLCPGTAISVPDDPYREPRRVHLFFGEVGENMKTLSRLLRDYGRVPGGLGELDSFLRMMHWRAWTCPDWPIRTRPHVVFGGEPIECEHDDQAVTDELAFSYLDVNLFDALSTTFSRSLDDDGEPDVEPEFGTIPEISKADADSVKLDPDRQQVVLGGVAFDVTPRGLELIEALIEANGEWVAGKALTGSRPDKTIRRQPVEIQERIETHKAEGYRWRP